MSQRFNQDWENPVVSPWSLTGANISRPAGVLDGLTDVLLSTTAGGGAWNFFFPAPPSNYGHGSARGAIVQARMKFRFENTTPVTGGQLIIAHTSTNLGVHINDGSFKLCLQGADFSQTLGATTLVQNTAYVLDWELRFEVDTGTYQRAWLDGVLDATHRDPAGSAVAGGGHAFISGGIPGAKGTSKFRWGDVSIWLGSDPQ